MLFTPVTPVHIGSGDAIEPYRYKLFKDDDNVPSLSLLNLDSFFDSLSDRDKRVLVTKIDSCDYVALRKFIHENADQAEHGICSIEVTEHSWNELKKSLDDRRRISEIQLHIRNPISGEPYIPGSSLKGSIRTALINYWAGKTPGNSVKFDSNLDKKTSANFEARVMGNIDPRNRRQDMLKDPFIGLNIPDIHLDEFSTFISEVEIVKPKITQNRSRGNEKAKILIYRELTWSKADDVELAFSTKVRFAEQNLILKRQLPKCITPKEICTACNSFYIPNLESEVEKFEVADYCLDALKDAKQIVSENPHQKAIIRLGRHSHFENVTIKGHTKAPKRGAGKSRTYVDGYIPMGWAMIEFIQA